MTALSDLRKAIAEQLRKPDCEHNHISWPWADVDVILSTIDRAGFLIVPKDEATP